VGLIKLYIEEDAQQRFSVGEQLRRILRIRTAISADAMRDRIEFLANWG